MVLRHLDVTQPNPFLRLWERWGHGDCGGEWRYPRFPTPFGVGSPGSGISVRGWGCWEQTCMGQPSTPPSRVERSFPCGRGGAGIEIRGVW